MPHEGDMLDNTQKALEGTEEDLGDVLYQILDTVKPLPGHINDLVSRISHLELINAAKVVPETIADEGEHAGKVLGATGETAGGAIGTIPAASTDILEDVESVGKTTTRGGKSLFKTKIRRK